MRAAVVGLLVAAAFVLSGCQYLLGGMMGSSSVTPWSGSFYQDGSFDPGMFGSFDPNDPAFSFPPPKTVYATGHATVTIDGKETVLGSLSGPSGVYEDMGTEVGWTDGAGLYLRFYGEQASLFGEGFVMLDRIADGRHLTTMDPTACKVTIDKGDTVGLSGTASCKGLRWTDMLSSNVLLPTPSSGEPAFDAEITFQAMP